MRILVPTINDTLDDFDCLFQLWIQVNNNDLCKKVIFDFSQCNFLRQNGVVFLGGLARFLESRSCQVIFEWKTLKPEISMNLKQNGFIYAFNGDNKPWKGNSIPYRQDKDHNLNDIVNYLTHHWLGRGWVQVSPILQNAIVATVGEIYTNAFEHGQSDLGVFSCGQNYPQLKKLKLTVIDFGVGIPYNVRRFKELDLLASKTLQWAFREGNTTQRGNVARGLGLDILKTFVKMNKGSLEIFSHDGYARIHENQETYENHQIFFKGTLVNITLRCEESYYQLATEDDDELLF